MKKYILLLLLMSLSLALVSCKNDTNDKTIDKPNDKDKVSDVVDDTPKHIKLTGPGNSPANWMEGGPVNNYEGYIYYIDRFYSGNLARVNTETYEEELVKEGYFNNINISGDYLFVYGQPPNEFDLHYGIHMIGLKDNTELFIEIPNIYPGKIVLYDDYFYFDSAQGEISRMNFNTPKIETIVKIDVISEFAVVNDNLYLAGAREEDPTRSIFEVDLDGNNLTQIIKDVNLGLSTANNYIFFSDQNMTTYNTFAYNIENGDYKQVSDIWMYYNVAYENETYYFSSGRRKDKSDEGIFVADANGENPRLVFNLHKRIPFYMAGKYFFQHENEGENRLIMMAYDGEVIKTLKQFKLD